MPADRPILTAELLSVGSELTVGETRDTNAGDLARSLTAIGVEVTGIHAVPDRLAIVSEAFATAIERADLVVSTGGLGPTPDDLTREAIAAAVGESPAVDGALETWLRSLWSRRRQPFPEINLKQAWLLPSATPLPNPNGTAPGWWVERADGGLVVALPGPPREMGPMWSDHALPRLIARGAGRPVASRTLRLAGIGESQLADLLGDEILRAADPVVATYARSDAVDLRISSSDSAAERRPTTAAERVAAMADRLAALLDGHVWAEGATTWPDAIEAALDAHGGGLAIVEVGTGGALATLLGDRTWIRVREALAGDSTVARAHPGPTGLARLARGAAELGEAPVSVGVRARPRGLDTAVSIAVVGPGWARHERRIAFLGGPSGRTRSALAAAHVLLTALRSEAAGR